MKIIHAGAVNVKSGGPALSTWLSIKGLQEAGSVVELISPPIAKSDKIIDEALSPIYTNKPILRKLNYVTNINNVLNNIGKADIYHIQGLWQLNGWQVAQYARKHNKPYVVTLRGMLYPQALAHHSWIKKASLMLYQRKMLRDTAVVQCTCQEELEHFRALGFKTPVAIIPNPIETENVINEPIPPKPIYTIGFIGRLHPRKRIERLIYAMYDLRNYLPQKSTLKIIGDGDIKYRKFLESEISRLNLHNVEITGFLTGDEKDKAIRSLSVLVVPSDFENFGNVVTEALVRGVPVIASKGTPWQDLVTNNCGWWIENSQDEINKAILESIQIGESTRTEMGIAGRQLIENNYSVSMLGRKMLDVYRWIIDGGQKPDCIYF